MTNVRATVFLEHPFFRDWAAETIKKRGELRLPFSDGKTSPIAASDVAAVVASVLQGQPERHNGKVYEITGARSLTMDGIAAEYSRALGRPIHYVDLPLEEWEAEQLEPSRLPEHVAAHFRTMAVLHASNRYDRMTQTVLELTSKPPVTVGEWVAAHADVFVSSSAQ